MKKITDKDFRYVNAASTNLRATFARVKREMAALSTRPAPVPPNVAQLKVKR